MRFCSLVFSVCLLVAGLALGGQTDSKNDKKECIEGMSSKYRGTRRRTSTGKQCQRWDTVYPHKPRMMPHDGGHHAYCRNPDQDPRGTWCYTVDLETRWEYCEIPKCYDESSLIWTSFNPKTNQSMFDRKLADLEFVNLHKDMNAIGSASEDLESKLGHMDTSHFKAIEADRQYQRLYFTDSRGKYFGIFHMDPLNFEKHLEGMAGDVESISLDPVSRNLYWTDSKAKMVMVAKPNLKTFASIYEAAPYSPMAIEVHPTERMLIFSTYLKKSSREFGAKIITTDLAGKNEKVILDYPKVKNVVGLTVDTTENKIYYIEDLGYASKLSSCEMNGTNVVTHRFMDGAIFKDIAVYSDYIYVTNAEIYVNFFGQEYYKIHVITKYYDQLSSYLEYEKPHGISLYQKRDKITTKEKCKKRCDGICLPRKGADSECVCSYGYKRDPKTKRCIAKITDDDYILVVDGNAGKLFQFSLKTGGGFTMARVAIFSNIRSVAVDPSTRFTYFTDAIVPGINKGVLGSKFRALPLINFMAKNIEIDPHTRNIVYADDKSIYISNAEGTVNYLVSKSSSLKSSIKSIALDLQYKMIYWTDSMSDEGQGKVLRCNFDGRKKEVVLDGLDSPHGIAIDYENNTLYVLESKTAIMYGLRLNLLKKISSTAVSGEGIRKIDLMPRVSSRRFAFSRFKIHQGKAYIIDEEMPQLLELDLRVGASSLSPFGPAKFFGPIGLSIYSKSAQASYKKLQPNPCKKRSCLTLCIALSERTAKCAGKKPYQ